MWEWNAHVKFFGGRLPDGTSCGDATCTQIKKCLQDAEDEWERLRVSGEWPYDFIWHSCISFTDFALPRCCMSKGVLPTRVPGIGEELRACCERKKQMKDCDTGQCRTCGGGGTP